MNDLQDRLNDKQRQRRIALNIARRIAEAKQEHGAANAAEWLACVEAAERQAQEAPMV